MRVRRKVLAAVVTAATILTTLGVASPASAAGPITVDLSASTGAIKHGANGFLYGLGSEGVPTDTMLNGLTRLGIAAQGAPDGLQHPTGDPLKTAPQWKRNGGGDVQIYMQDIYTQFPYEKPGLTDYLAKVDVMVRKVVADPNRASFVYVPFNEPNDIWYQNDINGLQNDYKTVYAKIRSIDPQARIAGPNFSRYDAAGYRSFMTFAKANNIIPDVITWHELGNDFFTDWYAHYDSYRQIERDLQISPRPISINEYGRAQGDVGVPGNMVQFISRLENSKVDGSVAYWQPAGTLDELVTQNNRATGAWWLHHWYGLMSGNTVNVSLPDRNQPLQAIATYNSSVQQARVLLGGNIDPAGTFDTALTVRGLANTAFAQNAHVTVWGVDNSGSTPSSGPYVVRETDVAASGGALNVPLTGLRGASAYYAIITPATSISAVAANRYEAEYARNAGPAFASYGPETNYSGTGYAQGYANSTTASTSYFVTAPAAGFYNVSLRYAAGPYAGAPVDRSLRLSLNQQEAKIVALPGTGAWSTWRTATVRVYLPAGINHINFGTYASDERDVVNQDYVQIDATTGPATTYQAEATGNTRTGTAAVSSDQAASGGALVGFIGNGGGNALQFNNVTASAAGNYTLTFAYANAEVGNNNQYQIVDRFADISVNGAAPVRVAFANTRNWSTFWTASVRVTLPAGNNTVRVGNAIGYAPNLDALTVAPTVN